MNRLIILISVLWVSCGQSKPAENFLLKPRAFQEKLAASPDAILLDVRSPEEVKQGYLKGAINFDFNASEFNVLIAGMDKSKPYFVYCAKGVRSGKAAEKMRELDFKKVYTLEGGINAWNAEGMPLQKVGQ